MFSTAALRHYTKEASKTRVSEAKKRAAALGAELNTQDGYVKRTEGRLADARRASDDWEAAGPDTRGSVSA